MRRLKTRNTTTDFYEIQLFKYEKFQREKSKNPLAFKKRGSFEIEELVVAASVLNQWQGILKNSKQMFLPKKNMV